MSHAINWFEIPVTDLGRASRFYEGLFATTLKQENFFGSPMAIFVGEKPSVRGALVKFDKRVPSAEGSLIYLNANGQLDACLERAVKLGGAVVAPKTSIGPMGEIATIRDTEGNFIGLHAEAGAVTSRS